MFLYSCKRGYFYLEETSCPYIYLYSKYTSDIPPNVNALVSNVAETWNATDMVFRNFDLRQKTCGYNDNSGCVNCGSKSARAIVLLNEICDEYRFQYNHIHNSNYIPLQFCFVIFSETVVRHCPGYLKICTTWQFFYSFSTNRIACWITPTC